jgi:hypothetical protein
MFEGQDVRCLAADRVGAILYSVFAVALAYSEASGFGYLPPDMLARPTMR